MQILINLIASYPYIIPDRAYDKELGYVEDFVEEEKNKSFEIL